LRPRIALATYDRAPSLAPDDRLLIPAFAALGIDAEPAVWSSPDVVWEMYDGVVVRSCWDYHLRYAQFRVWLERLDAGRVAVWNPIALLEWNSHKRYLIDLSRRGVAIVPTRLVAGGADAVTSAVAEAGWPRFVLKPAVSASGFETHAMTAKPDAAAMNTIARVAGLGDVLVQPFMEEVPSHGEYSLIYIGGAFSHAAIKRAGGAEFRVQTEHGGSVTPVDAEAWLIESGAKALAALPEVPLYARVDGVVRGGELLLMELELIEPNLFLELKPDSAGAFAWAVSKSLSA
jgi:glutathione synthase/RimK-type ligase-like ATP-grasp enzyme